jgi:hypothetical protein
MSAFNLQQAIRDIGEPRFKAWTKAWRQHLTPCACQAQAKRGNPDAQEQLNLYKAELVLRRLKG